jgi:hypothetical protein
MKTEVAAGVGSRSVTGAGQSAFLVLSNELNV